jgi:hypothetical protein
MSLRIFLIIASKIKHLGSYNARFARHNNLPAIIGQVKNYNIKSAAAQVALWENACQKYLESDGYSPFSPKAIHSP